MKLSSLFEEDSVLVHHGGKTLKEVVRGLLDTMKEEVDGATLDSIADKLIEREVETPTIVAERICIPHMRTEAVKQFRAGVAILDHPVHHPAADGKDAKDGKDGKDGKDAVDIVFLVLAPQDQNALMLQTMAAIARRLATKGFIASLRGVRSPARIIKMMEESGVEVRRSLTASDIMEPVTHSLKLETPLDEAVHILSEARDEGVPVFDNRGKLVGELTTREVLLLGMPKYMDLLANPEMLSAFEPFENYFRQEHQLHVRDIMRRDFARVLPSTQIVTVAHMMITQNRRRVYVMEDDKVDGVIYRKSILVRVMSQ
jgi:mannitol/fructose-specific phosphotransferase system IIA component (Ntr-type)/predicted transcriptional regulator